jgi:hypothetical protein
MIPPEHKRALALLVAAAVVWLIALAVMREIMIRGLP